VVKLPRFARDEDGSVEDRKLTAALTGANALREALKAYVMNHAAPLTTVRVLAVGHVRASIFYREESDYRGRSVQVPIDEPTDTIGFVMRRAPGKILRTAIPKMSERRQAQTIYKAIRGLRKLWHHKILHNDAHAANIMVHDRPGHPPSVFFIDTGFSCVTMRATDGTEVVIAGSWSKSEAVAFDRVSITLYRSSFYTCQTWEYEIKQFLRGLERLDLDWLREAIDDFDAAAAKVSPMDPMRARLFELKVSEVIRQRALDRRLGAEPSEAAGTAEHADDDFLTLYSPDSVGSIDVRSTTVPAVATQGRRSGSGEDVSDGAARGGGGGPNIPAEVPVLGSEDAAAAAALIASAIRNEDSPAAAAAQLPVVTMPAKHMHLPPIRAGTLA